MKTKTQIQLSIDSEVLKALRKRRKERGESISFNIGNAAKAYLKVLARRDNKEAKV